MYDEQIEVFVGQANVSASIGVLACFFINCFEYSDRAEYSLVEISAGPELKSQVVSIFTASV